MLMIVQWNQECITALCLQEKSKSNSTRIKKALLLSHLLGELTKIKVNLVTWRMFSKRFALTESGRAYLDNSSMFSQLPPNQKPPQPNLTERKNFDPSDFYQKPVRQSSMPPQQNVSNTKPYNPYQPNYDLPSPPVVNRREPGRAVSQPRLTPAELRRLPPSQRPPEPQPSKYTGSNIPCRSFRLLQMMIGEDVENQYAQTFSEQQQPQQPARPSSSLAYPNNSGQTPAGQTWSNSDFNNNNNTQRPYSAMSMQRPGEANPVVSNEQRNSFQSNFTARHNLPPPPPIPNSSLCETDF